MSFLWFGTPKYQKFTKQPITIAVKLSTLNIGLPFGFLDSRYVHTDAAGWNQVVKSIFQNPFGATPELNDCDDYALREMVLVHTKYSMNGIGMAWGIKGKEAHAFGFMLCQEADGSLGFRICEPNPGFPGWLQGAFKIGEFGYTVQKVFI